MERSSPQRMPSVASVMHDLGNQNMWSVLVSVASGAKTVNALTAGLPLTAGAVSRHLSRLQAYRLVGYERRKNEHVFHLNTSVVRRSGRGALRVRFETEDGGCLDLTLPVGSSATADGSEAAKGRRRGAG